MSVAAAGTNIGYHAILAGQLVGREGRVFALEADPRANALLERSVAFNGFTERTALHHAASLDGMVDAALDLLLLRGEGSGDAILGGRALIARSRELRLILEWPAATASGEGRLQFEETAGLLLREKFAFYRILPPSGNVYATPPLLMRVDPERLFLLPHCDLFATRLSPRT
jgi:hypothetical protein